MRKSGSTRPMTSKNNAHTDSSGLVSVTVALAEWALAYRLSIHFNKIGLARLRMMIRPLITVLTVLCVPSDAI
jgi:hypothetical protein